jgi:uncharacterized protein YndB with AHSA1/START domain
MNIDVTYTLPHSPAEVWRALTDRALVGRWLMETDLEPVEGRSFTFRARPVPGWDGVVHCVVLEVHEPTRLVYSWRGGSDDVKGEGYGKPLDTVVVWTLTPDGDGTKLALSHTGFTEDNAFAYQMMGEGWRSKVGPALGKLLAEP